MPQMQDLAFAKAALDFLATMQPKLRVQVIHKIKALMVDPRPNGAKKLKGARTEDGEQIYRERSGDYRILYVVRDQAAQVLIIDIDHRKDVYR